MIGNLLLAGISLVGLILYSIVGVASVEVEDDREVSRYI